MIQLMKIITDQLMNVNLSLTEDHYWSANEYRYLSISEQTADLIGQSTQSLFLHSYYWIAMSLSENIDSPSFPSYEWS